MAISTHAIITVPYIEKELGTFGLPVGGRAIEGRPQVVIPRLDLRPAADENINNAMVAKTEKEIC